MSKLTKEDVVTLRERWMDGEEQYILVIDYDISPTYLKEIAKGRKYKNIGGPIAPPVTYDHTLEDQQLMCEDLRAGKSKLWVKRHYGLSRRDMYRIATNCEHHIYEKIQSGELKPYIT